MDIRFRFHHASRLVLIVVLSILSMLAALKLGVRVRFELFGAYHSDVPIYLTVARGILNGLTPYSDLFENKAPGVFLLAALSLKLFDGPHLLVWLQATCIFLFPLTIAVPLALNAHAKKSSPLLFGLIGWIIGCVFALYTADQAGTLLPESFGAFFAALFLGQVWLTERHHSWTYPRIAIAGMLLLVTVGIKEPFFLSLIAATMLLLPRLRDWRPLGWSFLLAAVIGVAALLLLGWAKAYVSIHLSHMFGYHMFHPWGTLGESPWLRTVDVIRLWRNLAGVSSVLPWIVLLLWIGALVALLYRDSHAKERWKTIGRWLLASWTSTFAVGLTGDFYGHHFLFALPLYIVCVFLCAEAALPQAIERVRVIGVAAVLMLSTVFFIQASSTFDAAERNWEEWIAPQRRAAETLDRVMDRCGLDRYFNLIDRADGFYGLTHHSPYGPIFTQYARFIGVLPAYLEAFTEALTTAPIIIMRTKEESVPMHPDTWAYVESSFTETPWLCVGDFTQPLPYRLLFRRGITPRMP